MRHGDADEISIYSGGGGTRPGSAASSIIGQGSHAYHPHIIIPRGFHHAEYIPGKFHGPAFSLRRHPRLPQCSADASMHSVSTVNILLRYTDVGKHFSLFGKYPTLFERLQADEIPSLTIFEARLRGSTNFSSHDSDIRKIIR